MRAPLLPVAAFAGLLSMGATTAVFAAGDADGFKYMTRDQAFATVTRPDPAGNATSNPISNHPEFQEIIVQRTVTGKVETHENYSDYMMIVNGNGTLTVGGKVAANRKNPNGQPGEWLGLSSTGGKVYDLEPGVLVIIPKGMPHWIQLPKGGKLQYMAFKRKG